VTTATDVREQTSAPTPPKPRHGRQRGAAAYIVLGLLVAFTLLMVSPFILVIVDSFKTASDYAQHGPLALVEPGVLVIAVARAGAPEPDLVTLLARLREDLGADLMVASDDAEALRHATWPVSLPAGTPEWLGPIVSIVVGQLHALHLTRARGLDPEHPRNLRKVTRTT